MLGAISFPPHGSQGLKFSAKGCNRDMKEHGFKLCALRIFNDLQEIVAVILQAKVLGI
jgi:hypothetical protein